MSILRDTIFKSFLVTTNADKCKKITMAKYFWPNNLIWFTLWSTFNQVMKKSSKIHSTIQEHYFRTAKIWTIILSQAIKFCNKGVIRPYVMISIMNYWQKFQNSNSLLKLKKIAINCAIFWASLLLLMSKVPP